MNGTRFVLVLVLFGVISAAGTWMIYQRMHFSTRDAQVRGGEARAIFPQKVSEKITPGMLAIVTVEGEKKHKRRAWVAAIEKRDAGQTTVLLQLEDPLEGNETVACHVTVDGTVHRTDVAP